jgi:hypothetical protein
VLQGNGKVVPTRSVRPLNPSETHSEVEIKKRKVFDELIERRHGTSINPPKPMEGKSDRCGIKWSMPRSSCNKVTNFNEGTTEGGPVIDNGKTIGTSSDNPIMNTMVYEDEFPDSELREYSANILAENMLSQVDHDGHNIMLLRGIIDYKRDEPWRFQLMTSTLWQGLARGGWERISKVGVFL